MEKVTCGIVQDLLPSYRDGLTGENVTQMVQEHLEACSQCRQVYEENKRKQTEADENELSKGKRFRDKLMNVKYYIIGFLIGLMLPILTIVIRVLYMDWRY